ncbi:hypothetical protein NE865_08153 [Phthorimaea operculella]|nr:hypothetical protein NE865_08153 [Phthorimaea operculella]
MLLLRNILLITIAMLWMTEDAEANWFLKFLDKITGGIFNILPKRAWFYEGYWDGESIFIPWDDYYHYPNQVRNWPEKLNPKPLGPWINGSAHKISSGGDTPDWRVPQPPFVARYHNYKEEGRYYRIQPNNIADWMYHRGHEKPEMIMCYCVTVYKKFIPLGMGAVITYRNILTTALSTDMVVSKYRNRKTMENILGAWYNSDAWQKNKNTNNSYYLTPARIHYHPRWSAPEMVNRSHPIPCVYDLALWTTTKSMYYNYGNINLAETRDTYKGYGYRTVLCDRWSNTQGVSSMPDYGTDLVYIVGCQMVMDINRKPYPWFKYAIRFHGGGGKLNPCPKTDWEWFLCVESYGPNLRFGAEPGAALHVVSPDGSWRFKGLAGLNSFAMKLRSKKFVNYFTLLDRHPVLDWLYEAMRGRIPHAWLDYRFESLPNTPIRVRPKGGSVVDQTQVEPLEYYSRQVYGPDNPNKGYKARYKPIWW